MYNLFFLVLIFIFSSCHSLIEPKRNQYNYVELIESFSKIDCRYFPTYTSSDNYIYIIDPIKNTKTLNRYGAILLDYIEESEIEDLKKEIKDSIVAEYKPSDRCLLIVNMLSNEVSDSVFLEYYLKQCKSEYIPIPNFSNILKTANKDLFSEGKLSNNFTLYLLQSHSGKFLLPKYLTKGIGLPQKWQNGYSRGIAINEEEKIVIYWIEIW